ncbi:hypothetical protein NQ318_000376, partial [Aromia moschata]
YPVLQSHRKIGHRVYIEVNTLSTILACTDTYEVCKLSNETGNVAPDLATLRRRDLEGCAFKK